jgi:hypothetical protein
MHMPISFAARLAAGLAVGASAAFAQIPAPDCSVPAAKSPQLPATVPFELHTNHVAFWVCRGDRAVMYVLDTGAGRSFIDLNLAKSLGIETTSSFRATGAGAGSTAGAQIRRDSVTIPGASVVVPIDAAMDLASIGGPEGSKMQGILGADFIARFVVALDYRHQEMRVYDRATFKYDGPGTTVPIDVMSSGFIRVNATVGLADGSSVSGDMTIDVGASLALSLPKPFVESHHLRDRIGPTMHRPAGRGAGGTSMADVGRAASLKIGGVTIDKPITYLYGDSAGVFSTGNLGAGNIGGDILRRYTVYFDYRARRMILEPHDGTNEPFEADMSGLQLTVDRDSAGFVVDFVLAKSPAGELGMKKGDHIVAVDGQPASLATLDELRKRFRRDGEHIAITVKRGMTPVVFQLVTRRLV